MVEKPIHTHKSNYYLVLRPLFWFSKDEKVPTEKMQEYFTQKAISSLLEYGFLSILRNN